jgi:hypothetical protein
VITTTAIGGLGGNVFHGVGIYSQTQTEISRKKLKKLSQMQIIPKLFNYSNSIPQEKIISKHLNLECNYSIWQPWPIVANTNNFSKSNVYII